MASAAQLDGPALFFFDVGVPLLGKLAPGRAGGAVLDMGFRAARHGRIRRGGCRGRMFGENKMVDVVLWVCRGFIMDYGEARAAGDAWKRGRACCCHQCTTS